MRMIAVPLPTEGNLLIGTVACVLVINFHHDAFGYPPAVGILGRSKTCLSCHRDNGPWKDDEKTILDILDNDSRQSIKQTDESFLIRIKRGEVKTLLTVIGRKKWDEVKRPLRNAWLYVDPKTIETSSLSKFAPGWEINLPMSCRLVGDRLEGYEDANITVLPMTIRPSDAARDGEVLLQVMVAGGETVKGKPGEGMVGNYYERKVALRVTE